MKRLLILPFLIVLLISCDLSLLKTEGEPFRKFEINITPDNKHTILLLSDIHFGREKHKKIKRFENELLSWLKKDNEDPSDDRNFSMLLLNGDIVDSVDEYQTAKSFIEKVKDFTNDNVIYSIGNHEIHGSSMNTWLSYDFKVTGHSFYSLYSMDGISIYKLDSGRRSFGLAQLKQLEKALSSDTNEIKLFMAHIPLSGSSSEATTLQMTIASAEERNSMISLMKKYKVALFLGAHHHKGNYVEHYDETCSEFISAAFHRHDFLSLETEGYFYELEINKNDKKIKIIPHMAASYDVILQPYIFKCP